MEAIQRLLRRGMVASGPDRPHRHARGDADGDGDAPVLWRVLQSTVPLPGQWGSSRASQPGWLS